MASTILNREVIKRIAELIELRMTWVHIAIAVGVSRETIRDWRNRGETDREAYTKGQRTLYHQLVDAIAAARTALFEAHSKVVRNDALNEKTTTTQVVKREADGSTTITNTKKIEPPNAAMALKYLALELPGHWSEVQRVEVDWRERVAKQGGNPDAIKDQVSAFITGTHDEPEPDTDS